MSNKYPFVGRAEMGRPSGAFSSSDISLSVVGPFLHRKFQPSSFTIFGHLAMLPTADSGAREEQKGSQR